MNHGHDRYLVTDTVHRQIVANNQFPQSTGLPPQIGIGGQFIAGQHQPLRQPARGFRFIGADGPEDLHQGRG